MIAASYTPYSVVLVRFTGWLGLGSCLARVCGTSPVVTVTVSLVRWGVRVVSFSSLALHFSVGVSMVTLRLDGPGRGTGLDRGFYLAIRKRRW